MQTLDAMVIGWLGHWSRYQDAHKKLVQTLGEERFNAAHERGQSMEFMGAVKQILDEFGNTP